MKLAELAATLHLRRQVADPELRAKLTPDYTIGCKRILIANDYYPSLTRENARVVTEPIEHIDEHSITTADGTEREVDTIIFSTGFHVTDSPFAKLIRGADGRTLEQVWSGSRAAYLGTAVAGFPNLFMIIGPNTGLGHTSMTIMIEANVEYVLDALRAMDAAGVATVDVRPEVQSAFNDEVQSAMKHTVWTRGDCASWYLDAHGRNTTLWPSFTFRFRDRTRRFRIDDYRVQDRATARTRTRTRAGA
jgi:cation diffusion facilitator CzcD-associated flavoprotein CzcO